MIRHVGARVQLLLLKWRRTHELKSWMKREANQRSPRGAQEVGLQSLKELRAKRVSCRAYRKLQKLALHFNFIPTTCLLPVASACDYRRDSVDAP